MVKAKFLISMLALVGLLGMTMPRPTPVQATEPPQKWIFETITQPASAYRLAFQGGRYVWAAGMVDMPPDVAPHGVTRFDRLTGQMVTFRTSNSGLLSDKVNTVFVDQGGDVWFATELGVSRLRGSQWQNYTAVDEPLLGPVQAIVQKQDGTLLFLSHARILAFDGITWELFLENSSPLTDIYVDPFNRLWLLSSLYPTRVEQGGEWVAVRLPDHSLLQAHLMIMAPNGDAYFGTFDGVGQIVNGIWSLDPTLRIARSFAIDNRGVLWATTGTSYTASGFYERRSAGWFRHTHTTTGLITLPSNDIQVGVSPDGRVWAGAGNYLGIFTLADTGAKWQNFLVAKPSYFSTASAAHGSSFALANSFGGGIAIYDGQYWLGHTPVHGMHGSDVHAMAYDEDGDLYILAAGSNLGMSKFDGQHWQPLLNNLSHRKFTLGEGDDIWLYHGNSGLQRFDGLQSVWYTTHTGLHSNVIQAVAYGAGIVTAYHQSWDLQMSRFENGEWTLHPRDPDNMLSEVITMFAADQRNGDFWMASFNRVARYDGVTWTYFYPGEGITDLAVLPNGEVWVTMYDRVRYLPPDSNQWLTVSIPVIQGGGLKLLANTSGSMLWFSMSGGGMNSDHDPHIVRLIRFTENHHAFMPLVGSHQ